MAEEKLDDILIGAEVEIVVQHKDYEGRIHNAGERANLYGGCTYGCLGSTEEALVFGKQLPFIGTDRKYFKIIPKQSKNQ